MSTTSETNTTTENELIVRSMKETCYIVAFCDKFKSVLKGIEFWPEVMSAILYLVTIKILMFCLSRS